MPNDLTFAHRQQEWLLANWRRACPRQGTLGWQGRQLSACRQGAQRDGIAGHRSCMGGDVSNTPRWQQFNPETESAKDIRPYSRMGHGGGRERMWAAARTCTCSSLEGTDGLRGGYLLRAFRDAATLRRNCRSFGFRLTQQRGNEMGNYLVRTARDAMMHIAPKGGMTRMRARPS